MIIVISISTLQRVTTYGGNVITSNPTALEIYDDAYNDELHWNEINWPPPDIDTDDDYGNCYIARVLSRPMATILKYHDNGFCDNGEYAASRIQRVWRSYILRLHLARLGNTNNGWSATIRTQLKWKESLAVKLSLKTQAEGEFMS